MMKLITGLAFFMLMNFYAQAQRLVMPGDHPDPSVVAIGNEYWASATTSNWFPAYPLMKSKDLIHWEQKGFVFDRKPEWTDFYFWAPEISYENGRVYIYYAAHKKNGNLCVGVASASKPEGPYTDHGPLMCEEAGSIDAFPMRDENGKLYLVWKEDANSVGKPTVIWAMEMNEARTALTGVKKELFRNDVPWEANLVEGVSMVRHGDYFYAFYAGAGCCGLGCSYGVGIARSKTLLGPWEKNPANPILANTPEWTCAGHGTPVEKDGKHYFLYHAYDKKTNVYTGRQGLLIEYRYTPDNWIEFIKDNNEQSSIPPPVTDRFRGRALSDQWQWSVFQDISYKVRRGELRLQPQPASWGGYVGQKTLAGNYTATTMVHTRKTSAAAGIAAIGDDNNIITAAWQDGAIKIIRIKQGKDTVLMQQPVVSKKKIYLRMQVKNGKDIYFTYSSDGEKFLVLNETPVDGSFLPPWDRAVRAGLVSKGAAGQWAVFDRFDILYE